MLDHSGEEQERPEHVRDGGSKADRDGQFELQP